MVNVDSILEIFGKIREPNEEGISIASKGFDTSLLAYLTAPKNLDKNKILALAIVNNMDENTQYLAQSSHNQSISELYAEVHSNQSPEANFVNWTNGNSTNPSYTNASDYIEKHHSQIFETLHNINSLKRTGWKNNHIENPESVAEHSYCVALLVLSLAPEHINISHAIKIALIHDIQESIVGDFTPYDKITTKEKMERELIAARKISKSLNNPEMLELFIEYEKCNTPEAKFVKDIDRLDAVLLAQYYDNHKRAPHLVTPEFSTYAAQKYIGGYNCEIVSNIYTSLKTR